MAFEGFLPILQFNLFPVSFVYFLSPWLLEECFLRESTCKSENIILETMSVYECVGGVGRGCGGRGGLMGKDGEKRLGGK